MPSPRTQATEIKQERARLLTELRTKSESWGATMTPEQRTEWDRTMTRVEEMRADAERYERMADVEDGLGETDPEQRGRSGREDPEQRDEPTFVEYRGRKIPIAGPTASPAYRSAFTRALTVQGSALTVEEQRALSAASATEGGFTVTPMEFAVGFLQAKDNMVLMRRLGTVLPPVVRAESLGVLALDADMDDAEWTSELSTGRDDDKIRFGRRELHPHPLAKRAKVSKKLLRASSANPDGIVRDRLSYKTSITEEKAFLTGDGAKKPLGLFTASKDGISTARDFSDGNTQTDVTFDALIAAKYKMKPAYWAAMQWLFHPDQISKLARIKNDNGDYQFRESVRAGEPDRLLNLPFNASEYSPNTFTAGKYVGMLADFSYYWMVDALSMEIQVLLELYAETNQNGYILRQETDGMPVLEEAFLRIQLAP
jgi:HK97 family phage major capsid protein